MSRKLFYVKLTHTVIWLFYVVIIFYILYAGILNKVNLFTWVAIGLVVLEGIILILFKWKCPLTVLGAKYTEDQEVGFDIYLPQWLAKHNKAIFTTIFGIGVIIVVYRMLST
jgi:hypothetical protein